MVNFVNFLNALFMYLWEPIGGLNKWIIIEDNVYYNIL